VVAEELDSGKLTGRSVPALIASTTSFVNAPCAVEVPIKIVGATCRTASSSEMPPPPVAQPVTSPRSRAYGF
jgi:hypothetical protein